MCIFSFFLLLLEIYLFFFFFFTFFLPHKPLIWIFMLFAIFFHITMSALSLLLFSLARLNISYQLQKQVDNTCNSCFLACHAHAVLSLQIKLAIENCNPQSYYHEKWNLMNLITCFNLIGCHWLPTTPRIFFFHSLSWLSVHFFFHSNILVFQTMNENI